MSNAIWNKATQYLVDDVVFFNGDYYKALATNINSQPPSADWLVQPVGDIAGVIAGAGLSGGGSSGVVTLANAGVLSVDGATGVLTTKCGGWHKNTGQTVSTTGAPSFVSLTWQQSSYGNTTTISQNAPNGSAFTVNQRGVYSLSCQIQYSSMNTATLTDRTLRTILVCNRGGNSATILTTSFDFPDNVPTNPTHQCNGMFELLAGDIITWQTVQYLSAGSFSLQGQSAAPFDFDLNTFWNWALVKPLP